GSPGVTEIAATLNRHGVNVSVDIVPAAQTSAAEEIQRRTEKSELLVMGAYGQSRFRELVFGGVTRHLLRNMTIPLLLSHSRWPPAEHSHDRRGKVVTASRIGPL